MATDPADLLRVRGISKAYPGVQALDDVSMQVRPGEVYALLGENGAGKSTLMKIIAGSVRPDQGEAELGGRPLPLGDPIATRRAGVGAVYQELSLVGSMTVQENILLGNWPRSRQRTVDRATLREEAERRLTRVGLDVDPGTRVRNLGVATRQRIELAKALNEGTRVLLLDEPTSALSDPEALQLFSVIDELREARVGIVYVSHHLREIVEICDRVTVLRDGRWVETCQVSEVDEDELARMMVGREVGLEKLAGSPRSRRARGARGQPALRVRGLEQHPRLKPVDLDLDQGEIVTVFGLVGAGRTRLANTLFGIERATGGTIELFGEQVTLRSPQDAIRRRVGYLGESRSTGILPMRSVAENVTLASLPAMRRRGVLRPSHERELAKKYIIDLRMRVAGPDQTVETLSGGNQQKVLLARWLCSNARLLILDDPTRGIDIGAKEEVFRLVRELADDGVAVLYLTSEIKEARALAHRLFVMSSGRFVDELPLDASDDRLMAAAGGAHG